MREFGRYKFEGAFEREDEIRPEQGILLVHCPISDSVLHIEVTEDLRELAQNSPLRENWITDANGEITFWVKYGAGIELEELQKIHRVLRFHYHLSYLSSQ